MLLNTLFLCIDSSWFNIFSTSAIIFITCQNPNHITNRMTYRGNINNTFVTIFLIGRPAITNFSYFRWLFPLCKFKVPFLYWYILRGLFSMLWLNKTPEMVPLREPPGGFRDIDCCCYFTLTGGFSFIAFRLHPSPFSELFLDFYTHLVVSDQLLAEWFATLSF